MTTIYLHIGFGKTGSSALQIFLAQNSNILLKHNYYYPELIPSKNAEEGQITSGNAMGLANCFINDQISEKFRFKQFAVMDEAIKKDESKHIILSSEFFMFFYENHIESFFEHFKKYKLRWKIICYVRRQDNYLESAWKQWGIKQMDIMEYKETIQMNWLSVADKWAEVFGKGNIIIRPYEKQQMPDGIIIDFLKIINIAEIEEFTFCQKNINPGFNRDVIELIRLNRELFESTGDNRLFDWFYSALNSRFIKPTFAKYNILTPQQRLSILKEYDSDNRVVAIEYLGRNNGDLFYEEWPIVSENYQIYDGLTFEKYFPIATQLGFSNHEMIVKLRLQVDQLNKIIIKDKQEINELKSKLYEIRLPIYYRLWLIFSKTMPSFSNWIKRKLRPPKRRK